MIEPAVGTQDMRTRYEHCIEHGLALAKDSNPMGNSISTNEGGTPTHPPRDAYLRFRFLELGPLEYRFRWPTQYIARRLMRLGNTMTHSRFPIPILRGDSLFHTWDTQQREQARQLVVPEAAMSTLGKICVRWKPNALPMAREIWRGPSPLIHPATPNR